MTNLTTVHCGPRSSQCYSKDRSVVYCIFNSVIVALFFTTDMLSEC